MMELILTGANGSELAVEGVMRTAIDHIKKLEEQNTMMLDALNKLLHVAKIAVPIKFTNIDEVVSDCKQVINRVEGEQS
jgi:hypothetical protein